MKKHACGKNENDEVVVRIVNPETRALVARPTQFGKLVDLLLTVGSNDTGRPVLLIGCQLEGEWMTLDLLKDHTANWWDRLNEQKRRTLPPTLQKLSPKCQTHKGTQSLYNSNLARPRPAWSPIPGVESKVVFDPVNGGRDLNKLPRERKRARAEIHKRYARAWKSHSQENMGEENDGDNTLDILQTIASLLGEQ
ncbi:Hypothetical predicted protein [Cloeon dipterum]|uniref:Uncharacterized protein n=1 Tax=Cloeon dipterum TaxID=197152 RepID=A0A8S1CDM9_9INSE|nr:Hypothetical predicted protein [Cloeon dipterum]